MTRLRVLHFLAKMFGLGYAIAAFIAGVQTDPNRIMFTLSVAVASIAFALALETHERMNDLRKHDDSR